MMYSRLGEEAVSARYGRRAVQDELEVHGIVGRSVQDDHYLREGDGLADPSGLNSPDPTGPYMVRTCCSISSGSVKPSFAIARTARAAPSDDFLHTPTNQIPSESTPTPAQTRLRR